MSTTSTPEENDPNVDNRSGYIVPPIVGEYPEVPADEDGFELETDTEPPEFVDDEPETFPQGVVEEEESDDSMAP